MIVPKFTKADITKALNKKKEIIEAAMLQRLLFVGENFIRNVRENANFTDRTGNLRNSAGYIILHNGKVVTKDFKKTVSAKGKDEGVKKAQKVANDIAAVYPNGFVLIGVAGMEYAAAVESKGFDVLTGSALIAEDALKKAMTELKNKINSMK